MSEVWLSIEGYDGLYQVSNLGRVKSLERVVVDKNGRRCRVFKERILSNICAQTGYHFVSLHRNSERAERRTVHRLVMETFYPTLDKTLVVDHINGVRSDNRIENLRWVTYSQNNENKPYTRYLQDLLKSHSIPYLEVNEFEG